MNEDISKLIGKKIRIFYLEGQKIKTCSGVAMAVAEPFMELSKNDLMIFINIKNIVRIDSI